MTSQEVEANTAAQKLWQFGQVWQGKKKKRYINFFSKLYLTDIVHCKTSNTFIKVTKHNKHNFFDFWMIQVLSNTW